MSTPEHPAWYAVRRAARAKRPRVELAPGSRIVGDLHLDVGDGHAVSEFEDWLGDQVGVPRLVFVGDLFEYWFGDGQAAAPGGRRALGALRGLVEHGTAVDLVPGNRDFLVGRRFEEASGVTVRRDGIVATLASGRTALVLHGDELCTFDVAYQRFRGLVRSRPLRLVGRCLPGWVAARIAQRLRATSRAAVAAKPGEVTEQRPEAVRALAEATGVGTVACGHAHRHRDEWVAIDGEPRRSVRWIVLDALGGRRDSLEVREGVLLGQSSGYPGPHTGEMAEPLVIAIDGPAGAGKSTVARRVAGELGLPFLDTGAMYRAVTLVCRRRGVDPEDGDGCGRVARSLVLTFDDLGRISIDGEPGEPHIRSAEVDRQVSQVSAHAAVRHEIVAQQQRMAEVGEGLVAEGRDTTTVVFPGASHKFFLWASPEERARRRALQVGSPESQGRILEEILERDAFDAGRELSPLVQAPDAVRIEADDRSVDEVAELVLQHVRAAQRG